MWKAKLTHKQKIDNRLRVVIQLSDGKEKVDKEMFFESHVDVSDIKKAVENEIVNLESMDRLEKTLKLGDVDLKESKKDYIFIQIPRTATEAMAQALGVKHVHQTAIQMKNSTGPAFWEKSYKFTVVRDPYERFLSSYSLFHLSNLFDINDFLANPTRGIEYLVMTRFDLFRPQIDYVNDESGLLMVDYVGKFEELESSWEEIKSKTGVTGKLPQVNQSPKKDTLNSLSKKVLKDYYKDDFKFFNYQP